MRVRSLVIAALVTATAGCTSPSSPDADDAVAAPPSSPSEASPSEASPSEAPGVLGVSVDGALGVVDEYFAAFAAGDVDGMMQRFADDVVLESYGDTDDPLLDRFRLHHEWVAAEGTEIVDRECVAGEVDGVEAVTVRCDHGEHRYLSRAVGGTWSRSRRRSPSVRLGSRCWRRPSVSRTSPRTPSRSTRGWVRTIRRTPRA